MSLSRKVRKELEECRKAAEEGDAEAQNALGNASDLRKG